MPDSPTSDPESEFVCDCEEGMREACAGEPFYGELEGKRYCVLHFPGKEKSADFEPALQRKLDNEDFDFRGVWFPDKLSFENFELRTKADFSFATFSAEADFTCANFKTEANFGGATFSAWASFGNAAFRAEANFIYATFIAGVSFEAATFNAPQTYFYSVIFRTNAHFSNATFTGDSDFRNASFNRDAYFRSVTFGAEADFGSTTFSAEADFRSATFTAEADFRSTSFSDEADFRSATFGAQADFRSATFSAEADFRSATFSAQADFRDATFADHVRFAENEEHHVFTDTSQLNFQFARIEKPDRVSFHTLSLRPHWFVNIDARKFDFTNVDWGRLGLSEEISGLEENQISSPHPLLTIACRNLAVNAEENHRYEEASKFRYMALEARRLESWRGFAPWRLSWWYWLASGYGERVWQAFFVLLGILLLSALLYNHVGFARWEPKVASESDVVVAKRDDTGAPLKFSRALTYSAGVMILQKPEPRPATTAAQTVVLLETILGPVQAALLALAIRRKFMR